MFYTYPFLCARPCAKQDSVHGAGQGRGQNCPLLAPLIHENAEAQRGEVTCPRLHSQKAAGLDLGSRTCSHHCLWDSEICQLLTWELGARGLRQASLLKSFKGSCRWHPLLLASCQTS